VTRGGAEQTSSSLLGPVCQTDEAPEMTVETGHNVDFVGSIAVAPEPHGRDFAVDLHFLSRQATPPISSIQLRRADVENDVRVFIDNVRIKHTVFTQSLLEHLVDGDEPGGPQAVDEGMPIGVLQLGDLDVEDVL
jgi:hypothetical protein